METEVLKVSPRMQMTSTYDPYAPLGLPYIPNTGTVARFVVIKVSALKNMK